MTDALKVIEELESERTIRERLLLVTCQELSQSVSSKDRSLAKTSKVVNRLKKFHTEATPDALIAELMSLDLTMYMEELISALIEGFKSMKLRDSFKFVAICANLYTCYKSLGSYILDAFKKQFDAISNDNLRLRIYLRLLSELTLINVIPSSAGTAEIVDKFTSTILLSDASVQVVLVRLTALSFWVSRYSSSVLLENSLRTSIKSFYENGIPDIRRNALEAIESQEAAHAKLKINKGVVDAENESKYNGLRDNLLKIDACAQTLQSSLGFEDFLPEPRHEEVIRIEATSSAAESIETPPADQRFSDETEASFYTELLDLTARLPSALLSGDSVEGPSSEATIKTFLLRLSACSSRDEADELAIAWFESGLNSKGHRKRMALQFLDGTASPAQCRFLATIASFGRDAVNALIDELIKRSRRSSEGDNQVAAVKICGELCKLGVCPPGPILDNLAGCVNQFTAQSGEIASWVLVSCGRYLVNSPEVMLVADNLITRLMKLRNATSWLPPKVQLMIDDAYFQSKPRLVQRAAIIETPMEQYIKHLVQVEVYSMHEDELLRLMKRLPWDTDPLVKPAFKRNFLNFSVMNYAKISCVVSLLSGLIKYEEEVVVDIIDTVFENFQVSLERQDFRQAPQRVRIAKFIGELYAFKLIDSQTVFDVLYQLIGFRDSSCYGAGEETVLSALYNESVVAGRQISAIAENEEEDEGPSESSVNLIAHSRFVDEPAWSHVHIILVSRIVTSIGEFFTKGRNRHRMHRFLLLFRRFVLARSGTYVKLPGRILNIIRDMFDYIEVRSFDIETDTIDRIDQEIGDIVAELAVEKSTATAPEIADADSSFAKEVDEAQELELEHDDDDDTYTYTREEERVEVDVELAQFEKEMQQMMVESVAEARSKKLSNFSLLSQPVRAPSQPSSEDEGEGPNFRVLSKSGQARSIALPDDSKLRQGRADYQLEQAEKEREKRELKNFILNYERTAQAQDQPILGPGRPISLGQAAGLRDDKKPFAEIDWSSRIQRHKNRRNH